MHVRQFIFIEMLYEFESRDISQLFKSSFTYIQISSVFYFVYF